MKTGVRLTPDEIQEAVVCDMEAMLELKHEYNKTSPYKHGGKVI